MSAKPYNWTPTQARILARAAAPPLAGRPEGAGVSGPGETTAAYRMATVGGFGEYRGCPGASRFFISDQGRAALPDVLAHAEREGVRLGVRAERAARSGNERRRASLRAQATAWYDAARALREAMGALDGGERNSERSEA